MLFTCECPVCGKTFTVDTTEKGRPGIYCSRHCATIEKYYSYVMRHLEGMELTPEARNHWRGRLFSDRNQNFK